MSKNQKRKKEQKVIRRRKNQNYLKKIINE